VSTVGNMGWNHARGVDLQKIATRIQSIIPWVIVRCVAISRAAYNLIAKLAGRVRYSRRQKNVKGTAMEVAKIAYVQWPDGLLPHGPAWEQIRRSVDAAQADILLTNEMPFGSWLPEQLEYDAAAAQRWVGLHDEALSALGKLEVGAVISSRPIPFDGRLANEAFVLEAGRYRYIHHKKLFPQEEGFFEETWFSKGVDGFECIEVGPIKVGVLLCTELFFNERARAYGKAGAPDR
jgi:N-carbamoylputrescine amidase